MTTATPVIAAPHSKESEMMVLGCMLTSINSLNIAGDSLNDSDFYFTEHQCIFSVLKNFHKQDRPADVHLVCEELKRIEKFDAVGGASYVMTLAQYAGTSAYIEEYIEIVKNKAMLREMLKLAQTTERDVLGEPQDVNKLLEELISKTKLLEHHQGIRLPIIDTTERLQRESDFLKKYRGQQYIGLKVKTIQEFNENFLGLRGLMLLAAAPNVGKTALTIQTALEVLSEEEDACLAYISLEMSEEQIFRRMLLNLSGLNFNSFVFGSTNNITSDKKEETFFTKEELEKIKNAENTLKQFGNRLQIIDQSTCPHISARTIVNYVEELKQRTKTSRAIVIIDYLQVWPTNPSIRFSNENETDKWRIGEMKKIRDAMNDDPVIVISEARKPNQNEEGWGSDLSDVMGSARGSYTPDVVMLFSQISPKDMKKLWDSKKLPPISPNEEHEGNNDVKVGSTIISLLAETGLSICKLKTPKCRDGMRRFNTLLAFHFLKNKFTYVNWNDIKQLADRSTRK